MGIFNLFARILNYIAIAKTNKNIVLSGCPIKICTNDNFERYLFLVPKAPSQLQIKFAVKVKNLNCHFLDMSAVMNLLSNIDYKALLDTFIVVANTIASLITIIESFKKNIEQSRKKELDVKNININILIKNVFYEFQFKACDEREFKNIIKHFIECCQKNN